MIYTIEEYIAQGFTAEEAPKIRRADELYDNWGNITREEQQEYYNLLEELYK